MEAYVAWYNGHPLETYLFYNRFFGPYAFWYWLLLFCNVVVPQALWFAPVRRMPLVLFVISLIVNVGMWLERFIITVVSLHRDRLPSSWGMYYPTVWDWATYAGTIGLFLTLMFLFMRFLPAIAIFEMKVMVQPPSDRPSPKRTAEPEVRA
jgi:molybdopterin-containing oxidoreductase family membrane subunit